jgi:hypothetical protein
MKDQSTQSTLFVLSEEEEYCYLFDRHNPMGLYAALVEHAARPGTAISREAAFGVIEGLVSNQLRTI